VISVDLNGDGKPDYVINYESCGSVFCGTAGCKRDFWISTHAGPYALKQSFNVQGIEKIDRRAKSPSVVVAMHGTTCAETNIATCRYRLAWNRAGEMSWINRDQFLNSWVGRWYLAGNSSACKASLNTPEAEDLVVYTPKHATGFEWCCDIRRTTKLSDSTTRLHPKCAQEGIETHSEEELKVSIDGMVRKERVNGKVQLQTLNRCP
jgi:hypothetical protein